ncbi:MAG TPA: hypothetical protein PK523_07110 [Elusimicrobiales bacterium]|nr:hypothetical protein [Elusimicrobiales bacterium]
MKKLIAMLALLAFAGNIASAELLKNFKYDGKLEVHGYSLDNQDYNEDAQDKVGETETRVQINAGFDLNDDADAVVSLVKNNREYDAAGENANTVQTRLVFEQAYVNLKGVFGLDHKVGRQYYGEAGDLVIYYGPRTWPYTRLMATFTPAIDAWTGWYKNDNWEIHAMMGKELNTANNGATSTDVNVSGIKAMTKLMDIGLTGYFYQQKDRTVGGRTKYLDVLGAKGKYAFGDLNVTGEYAMNMGKDPLKPAIGYEYEGFAYKLNADYSMDLMGKLGLEGEYYFASGDESNNKKATAFTAINGDYRPGIIVGAGYAALGAATGRNIMDFGGNWTPEKLDKLNVAAKYYNFSADKKNGIADKHLGNEFDVIATWSHSDNVKVKGYYAMFMPEDKNNTPDDAESMMGALFCVNF